MPAWAYRKRRFDAERCREGLRTLKALGLKFLPCQNKRAIVSDIRQLWRKQQRSESGGCHPESC